VRAIAKTLTYVIARVPALWPVLRGPTQRFWDRTAPSWDERTGTYGIERVETLAAAADRLPAGVREILELGTGTGVGARMLAERFPEARVDAVDLSEEMVRIARSNSAALGDRITFAAADAAELPFDDGRFDLVVQLNVPLYPREIARVLRRGGHVVVAHTLGSRTPYYTPEGLLRRRLKQAGFTDITAGAAGRGTFVIARRS
jgi:ubiquinone/menaquinone biosynthesis C-methylase UbiE